MNAIRAIKAMLVAAVGLWCLVVGYGNLADFGANWAFVQHVLSMDTVFPDNPLKGRAITDPALQRVAYWSIIAVQWLMGLLCLAGAWRLFAARRNARGYIAAKGLAAAGLALVFLLYFVGFVIVGGEWFAMWQSSVWDEQAKAVMFLTCAMLVLIVLLVPEQD